jgi:hypothetical protein
VILFSIQLILVLDDYLLVMEPFENGDFDDIDSDEHALKNAPLQNTQDDFDGSICYGVNLSICNCTFFKLVSMSLLMKLLDLFS